jgi:tetratricopeptide (TPR) repeat protein
MIRHEGTWRSEDYLAAARKCQMSGDFAGALAAARAAVGQNGRDPGARLLLVETLIQSGDGDEGGREADRLDADAQHDPLLLQHVARLYTHLNRHDDAARCGRRAVSLAPGNAQYLYNLSTSLIALGLLDEAEAVLDEVIRLAPGDFDAYYNRATLRKQTRERNHIPQLEAAAQGGKGEVALNYALAKELEDVGEYARSFSRLKRGAGARRRNLSYRVEDDTETMADIAAVFDAQFFDVPRAGHDDARAVFIVGLPRSGTTLVDRILSSHPAVRSLGELSNFAVALVRQAGAGPGGKRDLVRRSATLDFAGLGRAYSGSIDALGGGAARLLDKTPVNFLYLGLIAAALPKAHIIHVRRGAMDVCYAMYKTLFRMAYPFSYDLDDLGRYFAGYDRLMAHWRAVLPGRFLDVDYESLVADQEGTSRRIVDHCGLDWDEACLSFHRNAAPSLTASAAQVRQPLYRSSVGLWRRYESELAPLKDSLARAGVDVEYPA